MRCEAVNFVETNVMRCARRVVYNKPHFTIRLTCRISPHSCWPRSYSSTGKEGSSPCCRWCGLERRVVRVRAAGRTTRGRRNQESRWRSEFGESPPPITPHPPPPHPQPLHHTSWCVLYTHLLLIARCRNVAISTPTKNSLISSDFDD